MENEPKSSDDGDGVSQKEGKKRKADESQEVEIAKRLKGLFSEEFNEAQLSMLSEFILKQKTTSITLDGQGGSSEEERAAAVSSGKYDTNIMADDVAKKKQATMSDSPGTSPAKMTASYMETTRSEESEIERDDMKKVVVQKEAALKKVTEVDDEKMTASYMETMRSEESEIERDDMKQVVVQKEAALKKGTEVDDVAKKKQATLSDSPGTSPRRRAKMNASYMETTRSEESETERDDMKQVAVQKEAALKKGTEVIEVERGASDIESGDEQGDSVIESRGRRVAVVVYSPNVDLSNDEQHESIEQKGKCTIIANAVRLLKDQECRQTYGFEVLFGK